MTQDPRTPTSPEIPARAAPEPAGARLVTGRPRRPARLSIWRTLVGLIGMAAIAVSVLPIAAVFTMFAIAPLFAAVGARGSLLEVLIAASVAVMTLGVPVAIAGGDPRWVFGIRDGRDAQRRRASWRRAERTNAVAPVLVTGRPRRPRVPSLRGLVLGLLTLLVVGLVTTPLSWLAVDYVGLPVLRWSGMDGTLLDLARRWLIASGAGLLPILLVVNDPDAVFRTRRRPLRSRHAKPAARPTHRGAG